MKVMKEKRVEEMLKEGRTPRRVKLQAVETLQSLRRVEQKAAMHQAAELRRVEQQAAGPHLLRRDPRGVKKVMLKRKRMRKVNWQTTFVSIIFVSSDMNNKLNLLC